MASGGLDEHSIEDLIKSNAPIDALGVGTRFGTSADAPYIDSVYKLVELDEEPIIKRSEGKRTLPYAKQVYRRFEDKQMADDIITRAISQQPHAYSTALLHPTIKSGKRTLAPEPISAIRNRIADNLAQIPLRYRKLLNPERYPVSISSDIPLF